jgi:hypothetical protein
MLARPFLFSGPIGEALSGCQAERNLSRFFTDMDDEIPKWPMVVGVAFLATLSIYAVLAVVLMH